VIVIALYEMNKGKNMSDESFNIAKTTIVSYIIHEYNFGLL